MKGCMLLLIAVSLIACGDAGITGTYSLDTEGVAKLMVDNARENLNGWDRMSQESRDEIEKRLRKKAASAKLTLVLTDDGTFTIEGKLEEDDLRGKGTYAQEGEKVTLTMTHVDGKERRKPDVAKGTFKDGRIEVDFGSTPPLAFKK